MATFGSYGNLGGELVNVVELSVSAFGGGLTTSYTVPAQRYALVVIRSVNLFFAGGFPVVSGLIRFNFSTGNTFEYNSSTGAIGFNVNGESPSNCNFEPKLLNEGENIQHSGSLGATSYNFLIFEYRKP